MSVTKRNRRIKIRQRVRSKVKGTAQKPRLSVYKSNKGIYAQLINDVEGVTLAAAASSEKALESVKGTKTEIAKEVGKRVAEVAQEKGIVEVAFDRNGYLYHGRIKSLAEGAREAGLKF